MKLQWVVFNDFFRALCERAMGYMFIEKAISSSGSKVIKKMCVIN